MHGWRRFVGIMLIFVLVLSTNVPYLGQLPYIGDVFKQDANTVQANQGTLIPDPSTVGISEKLSISPVLNGESEWYYNSLVKVYTTNNEVLGTVYAYKSKSGKIVPMTHGGALTDWANVLNGDVHHVIEKAAPTYTLSPTKASTSPFERHVFQQVVEATGAKMQFDGKKIIVTGSPLPKATFTVEAADMVGDKYAYGSTVKVHMEVTEYVPTTNDIKLIQLYAQEKDGTPYRIAEFENVVSTNGIYRSTVDFKIPSSKDVTLYIRAYDAANRVDQETATNGTPVGDFGLFGANHLFKIGVKTIDDGTGLPFYDFTSDTLMYADQLANDGLGTTLGRTSGNMKGYPTGNQQFFGKERYATIFEGHSSDGGKPTANNQQVTSKIYGFNKPWYYLTGPVELGSVDDLIHSSVNSTSYNMMSVNTFNGLDVIAMFNGNPTFVLENTKKHTILNNTDRNKSYGEYYYIRDLAENAGADVSNLDSLGKNETSLEIYTTDYPDVTKFELGTSNVYEAGQTISFAFEGFEYVANKRDGSVQDTVTYSLDIVDGPIKTMIKDGRMKSNKADKNSNKKSMNRYDGSFKQSVTYKLEAGGTYKVRLVVTDAVARKSAEKFVTFTVKGNAPVVPPPPAPKNPPVVQIYGPTEVYAGEMFCLSAVASDPDDDLVDEYTWTYDGVGTLNGASPCNVQYAETGTYTVEVSVQDETGLTATAKHKIKVLAPNPSADFYTGGHLKENRKVTLNAAQPYKTKHIENLYPLVEQKWTVTASNPTNQSQIYTEWNFSKDISYEEIVELLFRNKGAYTVTRYVKNSKGLEATVQKLIVIEEDAAPIAEISTSAYIYRDAAELTGNFSTATMYLSDASYSRDDRIGQRVWTVQYDSDNDGLFTDETTTTIDSGNAAYLEYKTNKVGRYRIALTVLEEFAQETLPKYVDLTTNLSTTHRRHAKTEYFVEVGNMAPVVTMEEQARQSVEMYFHLEDSGIAKRDLETAINQYVLPELDKENIRLTYQVEDTKYFKNGTLIGLNEGRGYNSTMPTAFYDVEKETFIDMPTSPLTIKSDYDGNLYYFKVGSDSLYRKDYETGVEEVVARPFPSYTIGAGFDFTDHNFEFESRVDGIAFDRDNNVYFVEIEQVVRYGAVVSYKHINKYDPVTGQVTRIREGIESYTPYGGYKGIEMLFAADNVVYRYGESDTNSSIQGLYKNNAFVGVQGSSLGEYVGRPTIKDGITTFGTRHFIQTLKNTAATNDDKLEMYVNLDNPYDSGVSSSIRLNNGKSLVWSNQSGPRGYFLVDENNEFRKSEFTTGTLLIPSSYSSLDDRYVPSIVSARGDELYYLKNRDLSQELFIYNSATNTTKTTGKIIEGINGYSQHPAMDFKPIIYDLNNLKETIKEVKWRTSSENKFFVNLSNKKINGGEQVAAIKDALQKRDSHFVSIDTSTTKAIAAQILSELGLESTQITVPTITATETGLTALAKHVNAVVKNERVDIQIDHDVTLTSAALRNEMVKVNEALVQEGLFLNYRVNRGNATDTLVFDTTKNMLVALKMTNKTSVSADYTKAAKEHFAHAFIAAPNVTATNLQNAVNAVGKGTSVRSLSWSTITPALTDYILKVMRGNGIELQVFVNTASYNLTNVKNAAERIVPLVLQESGHVVSSIKVEALPSNFVYSNYNLSGTNTFAVVLSNQLTSQQMTHLKAANLLTNSHFIGIGTNTAKSNVENVVAASMKKGKYISYTSLDASFEQVAAYMTDIVERGADLKEEYLLKDEVVKLNVQYRDFENDKKNAEKWQLSQELSYFENEEGYASNVNREMVLSDIKFEKVGKYTPLYRAQDNPTDSLAASNRNYFDAYKKWSNEVNNFIYYVHRKPVADFVIGKNGDKHTFTSGGYDLDKESIDIGFGKGIARQSWSYRLETAKEWTQGLPPTPLTANYYVKNTVADFQGESAESIQYVNKDNTAPIASFTTDKKIYKRNEPTNIMNTSYDIDNDKLRGTWMYQQIYENGTMSEPTQFSWNPPPTKETDGTVSASWNPTYYFPLGEYRITLQVNDGKEYSNIAEQFISVTTTGIDTNVPTTPANTPPVALFDTDKETYSTTEAISLTNRSYDGDNDALTANWCYVKVTNTGAESGSCTTFANSPKGSLSASGQANSNWHPTLNALAEGRYKIKLYVNDGKVNSSTVDRMITVTAKGDESTGGGANTPPIADFYADKSVYTDSDTIKLTNVSRDGDNDPLKANWCYVKLTNTGAESGNCTTFANSPQGTKATDGTVNTNWHPTLKLPIGEYHVKLYVNDGYVNSNTVTKHIVVISGNTPPVASFETTSDVFSSDDVIKVTNTSRDADNDNLTATWCYTALNSTGNSLGSCQQFATTPKGYKGSDGTVNVNWSPTVQLNEGTYRIELVVNDGKVNSNRATKIVTVIDGNSPPVADFETDKPEYGVDEPIDITNNSSDPDGDDLEAIWCYQKVGDTKCVPFGPDAELIDDKPSNNWHPTIDPYTIDEPGNYIIKLEVTDGTTTVKTEEQIKIVPSKPIACMKVAEAYYYIGDDIVIENCSTDSRGNKSDIFVYSYIVQKNGNVGTVYPQESPLIDEHGNLHLKANQYPSDIGTWEIYLLVNDGHVGETVVVSATIYVRDQTVKGAVAHTNQWVKNIEKYNVKYPTKALNLNPNNGILEFIIGEKFMLTGIGDGRQNKTASSIKVKVLEYPTIYQSTLLNTDRTQKNWSGSIWKNDMFSRFKSGDKLRFEFTATFDNGWTAKDIVEVKMRNEEYWKQYTRY